MSVGLSVTDVNKNAPPLSRAARANALLVGMIGFGGMFAVYTDISTTMTDAAGLPRDLVPLALMVFGSGMVIGNLVGGRLADRSVVRALYLSMGSLGAASAYSCSRHTTRTRRWSCCSALVRQALPSLPRYRLA